MSDGKVTCLSTQEQTFCGDRFKVSHYSDGTRTIAHLHLGGEAGIASRKGKLIFERIATIEVPPAFADWISDALGLLPVKGSGAGIPCTGHVLSPLVPMATLREAAGLSKAAMARARGVTPPTIDDSEGAGGGVSVATLAKAAEALGGRLELRFVPGG